MTRIGQFLGKSERGIAVAVIALASLLPMIEMISRHVPGARGIPGSVVFEQQLTLWIAFLGAGLAAASDRLLGMSANTFVPPKWAGAVRVFGCGLTAGISASLCWASCVFVAAEHTIGKELALGVQQWVLAAIMPVGFLLVTLRAIRSAGATVGP